MRLATTEFLRLPAKGQIKLQLSNYRSHNNHHSDKQTTVSKKSKIINGFVHQFTTRGMHRRYQNIKLTPHLLLTTNGGNALSLPLINSLTYSFSKTIKFTETDQQIFDIKVATLFPCIHKFCMKLNFVTG